MHGIETIKVLNQQRKQSPNTSTSKWGKNGQNGGMLIGVGTQ